MPVSGLRAPATISICWRPVVVAPEWENPPSGSMRSRSSKSGSGDSGWPMR